MRKNLLPKLRKKQGKPQKYSQTKIRQQQMTPLGGHLPLVLKKFQNLMMRKVMYQLPLMVVVQQELVQ
ncbi:hypothetical protein DXD14_02660 [Ruminococcus sp. TF11-2AC]|nr:hypothetical protein DXD14_02660 [Ruminococcus sp. TF11-2AC]